MGCVLHMPRRRRVEGAWRMPGLRRLVSTMSYAARLRIPACAEIGAARAVAAAVAVVAHVIAEDGVRGQGRGRGPLADGIKVSAHGAEQVGEAGKPAKARCNRTS